MRQDVQMLQCVETKRTEQKPLGKHGMRERFGLLGIACTCRCQILSDVNLLQQSLLHTQSYGASKLVALNGWGEARPKYWIPCSDVALAVTVKGDFPINDQHSTT